jgi:hypothetical protein
MRNGLSINRNGTKLYYLNNKLHREDGPAVTYPDGAKEWYIEGRWHREDGPAIEYADRHRKYYYLENKYYSEENYWKEIERRKSLKVILNNILISMGIMSIKMEIPVKSIFI